MNTRVVAILLMIMALAVGCARSPEAQKKKFLDSGTRFLQKKDYARAALEFRNAARVTPNDPEPYYQLGLALQESGDWAQALLQFRKAADRDPKHAGAQLKISELLAASNEKAMLQEAHARLRELFPGTPEDAQILTVLALTEWKLAKRQDAERHLQEAFARFPKHLNSAVALAQLKAAKGDFAAAEKILQDSAAQSPPSANAIVALGEFYAARGQAEQAGRQFRGALQVDPNHGLALLHLAAMAVHGGRPDEAERLYRRISTLPDSQYKPVYAIYLFESGKTALALREFERLFQADVEDRSARSRYVAALLAGGRAPQAEQILTTALRKNPKDVEALLQRAALLLTARKLNEAQSDLNQVLQFRSDLAAAHYLLSKVHEGRGDSLNQRQALDQALQRNPEFLPARLELVRLLLIHQAARAALDVLGQTPQSQKNAKDVMVWRNWALLAGGRRQEARQAITDALALARIPELLVQDAMLKLSDRLYHEARARAREALAQNPEDLLALEILSQSYFAERQPQQAVREVRRYAALRPRSAPVQTFLGRTLLAAGDRREARTALEAAAAADSRFANAQLTLAQMDVADRRMEEAGKRLNTVLLHDAGNLTARLWSGHLEEMKGNHNAAIDQYRAVLEIDPNNSAALNNLAYLLAEHAGQADQALRHAQKAKELAPESAAVEDTLGWVLYRKGVYDAALRHLQRAEAQESSSRRKIHLAMAYGKVGNAKRGQELLQAALRQDPNLPEAREAAQLLADRGK